MPQKYISPWPAADAMRRRAMTSGRNTWKQPEPQKPVERIIFGCEVDAATFRKYNHQNYTIGHAFYDLASVERWATDPDRAAKFPECAAEAKQIMERIIAEITGKDDKTVNTPRTASDFLKELQGIYKEARASYAEIQTEVDKAQQRMDAALKNAKSGDKMDGMRYEVAKADYAEKVNDSRFRYQEMIANYEKKVEDLRTKFTDYLNEHYAASPDKLDSNTMALLNSGICTPDELVVLVDRHKDCPTMVRIIGSHAERMERKSGKMMSAEQRKAIISVKQAASVAKNGDREMQIFDSAVSVAGYGLGKDPVHASRMDAHISGWFDDYADRMNNLPLVPDTMAPELEE